MDLDWVYKFLPFSGNSRPVGSRSQPKIFGARVERNFALWVCSRAKIAVWSGVRVGLRRAEMLDRSAPFGPGCFQTQTLSGVVFWLSPNQGRFWGQTTVPEPVFRVFSWSTGAEFSAFLRRNGNFRIFVKIGQNGRSNGFFRNFSKFRKGHYCDRFKAFSGQNGPKMAHFWNFGPDSAKISTRMANFWQIFHFEKFIAGIAIPVENGQIADWTHFLKLKPLPAG